MKDVVDAVDAYFRSGNDVPVTQATIKTTDWLNIRLYIDILDAIIQAKQMQIDRLMLEYCPQEMTPEQIAEWQRNQVVAEQ